MDQAVHSDFSYVQRCCTPGIFRSVWDRLAAQLFGKMPVDINGEAQIPNVDIWKDGVVRLTDTDPYSFTLVSQKTVRLRTLETSSFTKGSITLLEK